MDAAPGCEDDPEPAQNGLGSAHSEAIHLDEKRQSP